MNPSFRVTPSVVSTADYPDWRAVRRMMPPDFKCDGSSDPVLLYGLGIFSFIDAAKVTQQDINNAGEIHDFGFGPARLPGSGYSQYGMNAWNETYFRCLSDKGHPTIADIHWKAVDRFGRARWDASWDSMMRRGWTTYEKFLLDVDKTYRV